MKFNPNLHKRKSIRLKGYDYSQNGAYFITICCNCKEKLFGEVLNEIMILNEAGEIARAEWLKTESLRANIELGDFIIMPNHMHAIIIIHKQSNIQLSQISGIPEISFKSTSKTIGAIVRGYKSSVTSKLFNINCGVIWQSNYYDHVIRNINTYNLISKYIVDNPYNWKEDKFYC